MTPEDLADFVGPRNFLTKYKGVKQITADKKLAEERKRDRAERTFTQAGLQVVTREGDQILTIKSAKELNVRLNLEHKIKHGGQLTDEQMHSGQADPNAKYENQDESPEAYDYHNTYTEVPKEAVAGIDAWEAKHFGIEEDSDE